MTLGRILGAFVFRRFGATLSQFCAVLAALRARGVNAMYREPVYPSEASLCMTSASASMPVSRVSPITPPISLSLPLDRSFGRSSRPASVGRRWNGISAFRRPTADTRNEVLAGFVDCGDLSNRRPVSRFCALARPLGDRTSPGPAAPARFKLRCSDTCEIPGGDRCVDTARIGCGTCAGRLDSARSIFWNGWISSARW